MFLTLAPQPWLIFLDDAGIYVPNGQLAIYQAGTSTPVTTFADTSGVAHPFPITLDCAGRVPGGLYLDTALNYKFVLHRPQIEAPLDGAIIKSQDNITPYQSASGRTLTLPFPGEHVALDVTGVGLILYAGVGDLVIRGMVGGVHGQTILIRNVTPTSIVWLHNDDAAAPAGAHFANLVRLGPMPLVGYRSSTTYTYIAGSGWWMNTYEMGDLLTPPFDAADYTGDGGQTWTVAPADVIYENFFLIGRSLTYSFFLQATSVGGTPNPYLLRRLPYGWRLLSNIPTISNTVSGILLADNGAPYVLGIAAMLDHAHVRFERVPHDTLWTPSVNNTSLVGRLQLVLD